MSPLWTITSGLRAHVRLISSPDFAKQPRRCSSDRKEAAGARAEMISETFRRQSGRATDWRARESPATGLRRPKAALQTGEKASRKCEG